MSPTLAIVGAGAKAVAVAAKAAVLREMGVPVPEVVAIERTGVGANWEAAGGWTDGRHRLGTSPEKDIGFPYRSSLVPRRNAELDERMTRLSWQAFLIDTGQFAEWVDRGRPAPTHRKWSQYLNWVADRVGMNVVLGEVCRIGIDAGRRWAVHTHDRTVSADGLMITGPGQAERSILPGHPLVLSIAEFWHRAAQRELICADRVAVIGGGETAASMVNELFRHRVSTVTVISPQVTLFTRGEGFFENSLFSDPTGWDSLTIQERRDAMWRTDRGVFSARVQEALLSDDRIRHLRGRVAHAVPRDGRIRLTLKTTRGNENLETVHGFDLVIDGSGADVLWFLPLLGQDARDLLELGLGRELSGAALEESIGYDLAVTGVTPKLFLPNLAGLNQGPGFPNLSCLGLLADRVLGADLSGAGEPEPSLGRRSDAHQPVR
ncbi:pyridine nucleotide-disulfide oxidoreductase family protein [Mycolicibacterium hassiacum DSM 44199]|jgi:mycobactin lysine-N-oxygenase|uniref:L-lysine N6-monooxygenase MbtG n=1 Tax=Mycolicibacterium hassiacum (strain DSM 44199 / CIP 105218 / JCM 12690 / 3849) TaxID=1122247 RepID=K5B875_MYCHD|nr:NADPH-dependent L-lysine N(6)-monooxygenase MbtG [Mycolicibacterium hassiacum]EKF23208.1 pyridine nucleotide-disulfide oxidoreductase family protein [Mycolicibacterium hassiacum DSM 44199]MBX5486479.1 NADPH-dependent L-lysine N(6)-monooxygenase MbtG [Mycolicibacterium hassiacum]MDA4085553.1 lysine 6-monooxygenase [Mycolicibacterium hassiacum DSM 44199]PZN21254.1 MAG: lysine 6-monooxygenase [Mycolicibacterium hassiacum]VCT89663.1 L-lysine N6-monooxygenase MbtG [Mycolicibacterium hassiacum DS